MLFAGILIDIENRWDFLRDDNYANSKLIRSRPRIKISLTLEALKSLNIGLLDLIRRTTRIISKKFFYEKQIFNCNRTKAPAFIRNFPYGPIKLYSLSISCTPSNGKPFYFNFVKSHKNRQINKYFGIIATNILFCPNQKQKKNPVFISCLSAFG